MASLTHAHTLRFLTELGLQSYYDKFINVGFDDPKYFADIQLEDLLEMGMKKGHARRIIRKINENPASNSPSPSSTGETKSNTIPLPPNCLYHFMICKHEGRGKADAMNLYLLLKERGYIVWISNDFEGPNKTEMRKAVRQSAVVLVFLTNGIFTRPWCRDVEMYEAIVHQKPFVLVRRTKGDHAFLDYNKECCASTSAEWFDLSSRVIPSFEPVAKRLIAGCEMIEWTLNKTTRGALVDRLEREFENRERRSQTLHSSWGHNVLETWGAATVTARDEVGERSNFKLAYDDLMNERRDEQIQDVVAEDAVLQKLRRDKQQVEIQRDTAARAHQFDDAGRYQSKADGLETQIVRANARMERPKDLRNDILERVKVLENERDTFLKERLANYVQLSKEKHEEAEKLKSFNTDMGELAVFVWLTTVEAAKVGILSDGIERIHIIKSWTGKYGILSDGILSTL